MRLKITHTLAVAATVAFVGLGAHTALAGPPLGTDDTGTVEPGHAEVEVGFNYGYDKETDGGSTVKSNVFDAGVKVTTGIVKNLGISLAVPYTFNERVKVDGVLDSDWDGFGDMTLEVKYAFAELGGVSLAIKPVIDLPVGKDTDGKLHAGASLIASTEFQEGAYALHANVNYMHHEFSKADRAGARTDLWSASIGGEAEVVKGLVAVADFALAANGEKGNDKMLSSALVGARYEVSEMLDVFTGVKMGLTNIETDLGVTGGFFLKF